ARRNHEGFEEFPLLVRHQPANHRRLPKDSVESAFATVGNPLCQQLLISSVANITFVRDENDPDIVFSASSDMPTEGGNPVSGLTVLDVDGEQAKRADIYISSNISDFSLASNGGNVIIHEVLHALGLSHPEDSLSDPITNPSGFDQDYDNLLSAQSYRSNDINEVSESDTPMVYDIAALQFLYGANTSHNEGNTTYTLNENGTINISDSSDGTSSLTGASVTIWDSDGTDTYQLDSSITNDAWIDLRAGRVEDAETEYPANQPNIPSYYYSVLDWLGASTVVIMNAFPEDGPNGYGVIENAIGAQGNDLIFGNQLDNELSGLAGDDTFYASSGNDVIDGGSHTNGDTVDYSDWHQNVLVEINPDTNYDLLVVKSIAEEDDLKDIESLILSQFDDWVVGDPSILKDYEIHGGLGNDVLGDSAGDDVIKGGLGNDTLIAGAGENAWYGDDQPTLFDDRRNMDYDVLDLSGLAGAVTISGINVTTAAAETSTAVGFEEMVLTESADTVSESSGFLTDAAYQEILYKFGDGDDTFKSGGEVTVTETVSTTNKNFTITDADNFEALGSNAYFNIQTLDHDIISSSGTTLDFTGHASSLTFDMETYTVSDTSESLVLGGSLSTASFIGSHNGDVFNLADGQNDDIFLGLGDDIVNEGTTAGTASSSQIVYYGGNDTFTGFAEHDITLGQNITQSEISFSEENVSITDEGAEKRYDFDLVLDFDGNNSLTIENVSLLAGSGTDGIFGTSDDQVNFLNSDLPSIALAEGYSITFGGFEHYQFNAISPLLTNIGTVTDDTVVFADDSIYFARNGADDVTAIYQYGGTVYGGLGNDTIRSGQTTGFAFVIQNTFFGGEGDDTLIGDYGQNALHGGAGNDTIQSNDSYEAVLDGGSGRDTLTTGTQGTHYLYGGSGNDIIEANAQSVDIYGGSGHDRISIGTTVGNATVFDFNDAEGDFLDLRGFQTLNSGNFSTTATATGFAVTLGSTNLSVTTADGTSTPINVIFYGDQVEEGTEGVDNIDGSTAPSRIFGSLYEGNDIFIGSDFTDVVYGDEGDDDLSGGDGDDRIYGGDGDDVIDGGVGADFLSGGAGNDVLSSGTGDDAVLDGGDGNDQLYGDTGAQTLRGGDGNDFLIGYAGDDTLVGGAGNDEMYVYTGNETFDGGDGIDTLLFTALPSAITVNLAAGTATTAYGSAIISNIESVWGTNLADTISGNEENNSLVGSKGADTIYGGGGNDVLYGDRFVGGYTPDSAVDTLYGGDGNDTLIGMLGDDILYGDAGDDLFYDYGGDETFDGGAGDADHLVFYYSADAVTIDVAAGTATHSGGEVDTFQNIERFDGSAFADALTGGSGDDYLNGAGGNDTITGNGGANILNGSTGADTFVLTQDSMDAYLDTVADFDVGEGDALDVSGILTLYDPMTDLISDFIQMTDDGTDSFLAVDTDGGADNFVQIATLLNVTGLTDEADLETNGYLIAA
ncbi:MAG: type I secretion C-terminal target domain-containing protein, partial [Alphaproteobacteria bacterium]|nr:type I secretion C-terminal target domain-containing protein [Alphaproteobacteria bacterium]